MQQFFLESRAGSPFGASVSSEAVAVAAAGSSELGVEGRGAEGASQ